MQFDIKTPPQHCSWQEMLDIWTAVDKIETFTGCWNFDHFYPLVGDENGTCLESWVTLTALAAHTKRVRIGCMVQGTPYRHPALIANMATTLDIVSNGRLNLGLGAGWHEGECTAYGIDLLPMKQRMDRFEESVEVVKTLLTEEFTSFSGEYFQLANARCEPKGLQQGGPPIVIGGAGEKRTLRVVAKHADHWNLAFASPEQFTAKRKILEEHCQVVGRDISEIECSVQIALPADQAPTESASMAAALGEAGVDTIVFSMRNPYKVEMLEPLAKALETIKR